MNNYFCLKKSLFFVWLPNSGIEDSEECIIISVVDIVVVDVVVVPLLVTEVIDGDVEYLEVRSDE
jgi:hypothetical protein